MPLGAVLLVTCAEWADGEPGAAVLDAELAARQVPSAWARWDDPAVDWSEAGLIAVRSPWDYTERCTEFLAWARATAAVSPMLNGPELFAWNVDKGYLVELARHVSTVPTRWLDDLDSVAAYVATLGGPAVVKPAIGAGGFGLVTTAPGEPVGGDRLGPGPWVVQPVVESVHHEGEHSVWVIDGHPVSQVTKVPVQGELRVHEHFGGRSVGVPLAAEAADLATAALAAAQRIVGQPVDYGRVDLLRLDDGRFAVSELEIIEPGLYLDVGPENAGPFADLIQRRFRR